MATISGASNEKVYKIPKWLGLNEHPDGDTNLKMGEAAEMVNWRITRDGNLKRRPGTQFVAGLLQAYTVDYVRPVKDIKTVEENEIFSVYSSASAAAVPGTIVLTSSGGAVEDGVFPATGGVIANGNLSFGEDAAVSIEDGVLTVSNAATVYTFAELQTALAALGDGQYLYIRYDEVPYALGKDALVNQYGKYTLCGYPVRAVGTGGTGDTRVMGIWKGLVAGKKRMLAACDGKLWSLYDEDTDTYGRSADDGAIGTLNTSKGVSFIPFDGKVYILNGYEYYSWDGTTFEAVTGYDPLVAIAIGPLDTDTNEDNVNDSPSQAGELTGEFINRLNGYRRVWISPDGTNKTFRLPEKGYTTTEMVGGVETQVQHPITVTKVTDLATGTDLTVTTDYTVDGMKGEVTFVNVPAKAVNSYQIAYTYPSTLRSDVTSNLFGELYSGQTDTRIFIYGDGTNRALYSGMDYNGMPRADYFPDQYEVRVGDANTPITSMIRHFGDLVAFKTDSAWTNSFQLTELSNGILMPSVYCLPVNKDKGNTAPGQVYLVDNNPVTASGEELYRWINSSYYSSNITRDERQARRISDRIHRSLREMDLSKACACDDNDNQEYYISQGGITLVWNYVTDTWYRYEGLDITKMCAFQGEFYVGTADGKILRLTDYAVGDEGYPIEAHWESGAMDFSADYSRKYSSMMWVGLKPEHGTSVDVTVITDRKNTFRDKVVSSEKAKVPGEPFMVKTKIKAKKFVFYRLVLDVKDKQPAVTVTNVDFRVRPTGYTK